MLNLSDDTSCDIASLAISTKESLTCSNSIMNTASTMFANVLSHGLTNHAISTRSGSTASSTTHHHSSILLISSIRVIAVFLEIEGL